MDGKQFHLRTRIVLILLATVLLVFTWVLYDLQVVHGSGLCCASCSSRGVIFPSSR